MKSLLLIVISCSLSGMHSPQALRQSTFVDMPAIPIQRSQDFPGVDVIHRNDTPSHREPIPRHDARSDLTKRSSREIHIHIEEPKDAPSTPANSTEDTEDTIPKGRHNRRMVVSNSVSVIVATLVTAGVTLAVHFTSCKK